MLKINKKSQKWLILNYMKKNPHKNILATDFMFSIFRLFWKPFVWHSANARMSELANLWLIEKVWEHISSYRFLKPSRNRNIYKITQEWIDYKF